MPPLINHLKGVCMMQRVMMTDTQLTEKLQKRDMIYDGRSCQLWMDTTQLPDGRSVQRERIHHPGSVGILAIDSEGKCLLVRQYRHTIEKITLEIPAGKMDKVLPETPAQAALRELREETGQVASTLLPLGCIYPASGLMDETHYLFFAKDFSQTEQELDDDEFLRIIRMDINDICEMIAEDTIRDSKTICALFRARLMGLL